MENRENGAGGLSLAGRIGRVMLACPNVRKTGENTFHHYTYASDADLLRAVQPAMAAAGLAMAPVEVQRSTVEVGASKAGGVRYRTDVLVTYRLLADSGETLEVQAPGCGIDGEDKGCYKAMTGALKYALRQLFLIPTGDDTEGEAREPEPAREPDHKRANGNKEQSAEGRIMAGLRALLNAKVLATADGPHVLRAATAELAEPAGGKATLKREGVSRTVDLEGLPDWQLKMAATRIERAVEQGSVLELLERYQRATEKAPVEQKSNEEPPF